MKSVLLIISLAFTLLSGTFSVRTAPARSEQAPHTTESTSEQGSLPGKDFILTPAQSLCFFSEENGFSWGARTHQGGGQTHSGFKSAVKIIKNGKVIDLRQHPALSALIGRRSGVLSAERYLLAIRRIRI